MKKLFWTILFVLTFTLVQSQSWDTTRKPDLYRTLLFNTELGYIMGVGNDSINRTVTDFSIMTNPDSMFGFGMGVGLRYYHQRDRLLIPIYLEMRAYPFSYRRNFLPYIGIKVGYSFDTQSEYDSPGMLVTPNIGVLFDNGRDKFYSLSVIYELQSIIRPYPPNKNFGGLGLQLGYTF